MALSPLNTTDPPALQRPRLLTRDPALLAAGTLTCIYLAIMSGHLYSIDGLIMFRQAQAIAYNHSLHFATPLWWGSSISTSKYGLGLSLLYIPGLLLWSWLQPYAPVQAGHSYDFALLYADPLYTVAAAPIHILIAVASTYLVARLIRELGFSWRLVLWGLALYGLASPAIVYARGDWGQPLVGLCWIAALYAALRFRHSGSSGGLLLCALAVGYAVLTRPVEGTLLLPAVLVILSPDRIRGWPPSSRRAVIIVVLSFIAAVILTLLVNWGRYGSPLTTGYEGEGWTAPLATTLPAALISPGWGILWEFPAIVLLPLGLRRLWRAGYRKLVLALAWLTLLQLINAAAWHDWTGGWNWGLRLFLPALPVAAVPAAIGIDGLSAGVRRWLPWLLLAAGMVWAVPCIVTNLLNGYAGMASSAPTFALRNYPPIGAWTFLHHWRAYNLLDSGGADILWLRAARATGNASLIPPLLLLCAALALGRRAWNQIRIDDVLATAAEGTQAPRSSLQAPRSSL